MAEKRRRYSQKLDLVYGKVEMAHGAGGKAMAQLIEELFISAFDNPALNALNDQATLTLPLLIALNRSLSGTRHKR